MIEVEMSGGGDDWYSRYAGTALGLKGKVMGKREK